MNLKWDHFVILTKNDDVIDFQTNGTSNKEIMGHDILGQTWNEIFNYL